MGLTIEIGRHVDVTILTMKGLMTLDGGSEIFRETMRDLVWEGHTKFVLEYDGISYQDSTGNGELVRATTLVLNSGGELVLARLTKRMDDLMHITKLYTVYPLFKSLEGALHYFDEKRTTDVHVRVRKYNDVVVYELSGILGGSWRAEIDGVRAAAVGKREYAICVCTQVLGIPRSGGETFLIWNAALTNLGGTLVLACVEPRLANDVVPIQELGVPVVAKLDDALLRFNIVVDKKFENRIAE